MYCLYFLLRITCTVPASFPSTFLPFVVSKEQNPISLIMSCWSWVFPSRSAAVTAGRAASSPLFLPGERERDLLLERDRRRLSWEWRLLSLSLSRDLSLDLFLLCRSLSRSRSLSLSLSRRLTAPKGDFDLLRRPITAAWKKKPNDFLPTTEKRFFPPTTEKDKKNSVFYLIFSFLKHPRHNHQQ